ncbi:uncharacterized protein LOC123565970 [Mercenaria mercenaria]|uniref:uncharacterized protein LOC123565970 n=1 Tax=Mercenaria mercenaria TaxID=6596 RepID=UPI00234EA51D|nr:uncharacterized protein LOC123565970 [Mercenaria mercenaria]
MTLERQLEKTTCVETRTRFRQLKEEHNERQMMERKYYYGKREASRKNPASFLSLIVDGMDQSKTNLPHFTGRKPKSINGADLLKTHITGVINHGHGGFHTYVDVNEYPHDPNLTINIILKTLKRTAQMHENTLPPVCYIQADNCARENKNRYVLAFCELLVAEKIFNEVHLSFLYVGHTHEDVDAAFSKISEKLRTTDAETLDDLIALLPKPEEILHMFDVKNWLAPHIADIEKHSEPLHLNL